MLNPFNWFKYEETKFEPIKGESLCIIENLTLGGVTNTVVKEHTDFKGSLIIRDLADLKVINYVGKEVDTFACVKIAECATKFFDADICLVILDNYICLYDRKCNFHNVKYYEFKGNKTLIELATHYAKIALIVAKIYDKYTKK